MLGLPSTTEVNRRLPKEAFYRNLKLAPAVKESFVRDVESIMVANSVKASTANFKDGSRVHELLVMRINLKCHNVPKAVLEAINGANAAKKLLVCTYEDEGCLAVKLSKLVVGEWRTADELTLTVSEDNLDALWDSLASQIVFGDEGKENLSVEERFEREQKLNSLRAEIAAVENQCRKEKQFGKKNELYAKTTKLKAELTNLEKGI